jgi:hypothetical protein
MMLLELDPGAIWRLTMQECLICKKNISNDRELCEEHRNILKTVVDSSEKDPEMRKRWDSLLELARSKIYAVSDKDDFGVFDFIDEIKAEIARGV